MLLHALMGAIEDELLGPRTVVGARGLGAYDPIGAAIIGLGVVHPTNDFAHVEVRVDMDADIATIQHGLRTRFRSPHRILRVVGAPIAQLHRGLAAGEAVGLAGSGSFGTAGGFVRGSNGVASVLSNSHVLAANGDANVGDLVVDAYGIPVAALSRATRLVPGKPATVDAAIAELLPGQHFRFGGHLAVSHARPGAVVRKLGVTTGVTLGRVVSDDYRALVVTDVGAVWFHHQLAIEPVRSKRFSMPGDSGSMIHVEHAPHVAVGLLCAGDEGGGYPSRTYANHLPLVIGALGLA